jgi:hypothetical protein
MDQPYSNREIDLLFKNIKDVTVEQTQELMRVLRRIEDQTTKTNGRVSLLENWRSYITGAVAIFILIVLPMLIWQFNRLDRLSSQQNTLKASVANISQ